MEACLESVAAFARQHSKRIAVSEWGQSRDDADLVTNFLCWANANGVTYHVYWMIPPTGGEEDMGLWHQPRAAAAYEANCV